MEQPTWPDRILLLLRQGRAAQAEQELRRALQEDPDNPLAHAWLGMALLDLNQPVQGQQEIETAIGLAPEYDFAHYLLGLAHQRQQRLPEAQKAIEQALALDPTDPTYHHMLGQIRFQRAQWEGALRAAEAGLYYDAEHVDCLSLRARCLARLGRATDAADSLQQALRHDPDDAGTHADAGWVALEAGQHKLALSHFRDALRLRPTSEYAREGLVEALKARYWVYRTFLRFSVWTQSLGDGTRRLMFFGIYVLVRFVPLLLPLYLPLVFMSWFADPIFNGLLQLNSYGRHALSEAQRRQALVFMGVVATAIILLVGAALVPVAWSAVLGGALLAALFPLMVALRPGVAGRQRQWAIAAAVALLVLGVAGTVLSVAQPDGELYKGVMGLLFIIWLVFIWGTALS
ncbi:tetratricopeptide repeat protein [Hymenobacter tibetensis]|uniref:Tetratricopeptide repeat protein n=1 Tax=Hymenobacter tibetensis TaxID=497967 RepID=A0ABY4CZW4_9BACT|nr:tetratricopeptide repeat protein [Hymenobacter tibetensis]UOG75816.1 tetratricopeptide repeat protein [Hymenobacter tibetensis]